jgi:hypothetical protein
VPDMTTPNTTTGTTTSKTTSRHVTTCHHLDMSNHYRNWAAGGSRVSRCVMSQTSVSFFDSFFTFYFTNKISCAPRWARGKGTRDTVLFSSFLLSLSFNSLYLSLRPRNEGKGPRPGGRTSRWICYIRMLSCGNDIEECCMQPLKWFNALIMCEAYMLPV